MINTYNSFTLGYPRTWIFQPSGGSNPVRVFKVASSTADTPIKITTAENHNFVTDEHVVVYLSSLDIGLFVDGGNFKATRIDATNLSLQNSAGVTAGIGGFIAIANSGTGVTNLKCEIKASHTTGATVLITKTGTWVTDSNSASMQNVFRFQFAFTTSDISVLTAGQSYARTVYYTDANGAQQILVSDIIQVVAP